MRRPRPLLSQYRSLTGRMDLRNRLDGHRAVVAQGTGHFVVRLHSCERVAESSIQRGARLGEMSEVVRQKGVEQVVSDDVEHVDG